MPAKCVGIGGLLGAGRTEVARIIAGADRPDSGAILIDDRPASLATPRHAIRRGIGLLPEDRKAQGLIAVLTAERNIALPHAARLARFGMLPRGAETALARTGRSATCASKPIRHTAGAAAERRQSAESRPRRNGSRATRAIFIFDEPTRGVDVGAKVEIYQSDEPADRTRRRHHHDLVGAARAARHERSHPGHASRSNTGGIRRSAAPPRSGFCRPRSVWRFLACARPTGCRPRGSSGPIIGLVALSAVLWALTPHFLTVANLLNIAQQTSINAIVAVGMTYVICRAASICRSARSSRSPASSWRLVLQARTPDAGRPSLPRSRSGGVCGSDQRLAHQLGRTAAVHRDARDDERGARRRAAHHRGAAGLRIRRRFRWSATGEIGFVPVPVVMTAVIYALAHVVLTRTAFGRYVYAIGGNEEATRLSGVAVRLHKTLIYAVVGLDERAGRDYPDRAPQFGAADRWHDVRARRDCCHGHRRHEPDGRRRDAARDAGRRADHGRAAEMD